MYILAFILLIIALTKLCILGCITYGELKELFKDIHFSVIKTIVLIVLFDAILEAICGLYILL